MSPHMHLTTITSVDNIQLIDIYTKSEICKEGSISQGEKKKRIKIFNPLNCTRMTTFVSLKYFENYSQVYCVLFFFFSCFIDY